MLPILHLNGYKIANPTVLARIPEDRARALLRGYGYHPIFVTGTTRRRCTRRWPPRSTTASRIRAIQREARAAGGGRDRPRAGR